MAAPVDLYAYRARYAIQKHHDLDVNAEILRETRDIPLAHMIPPKEAPHHEWPRIDTVCIIGAGATGLYTAMILQSLNIPFTVLEASQDRVGGRLYTYRFDDGKGYDYYDVGAMRFPDTPFMKRTFELVRSNKISGLKLIPYYFKSANTFTFYNGTGGSQTSIAATYDPYKIGQSNPPAGIPSALLEPGQPAKMIGDLIEPLREPFKRQPLNMKEAIAVLFRTCAGHSMRSYMASKGYSAEIINYCETFDSGTAGYDHALAEAVLESLAFDWPWPSSNPPKETGWYCFDRGSATLPEAMKATLPKDCVQFGSKVTALSESGGRYVAVKMDKAEDIYKAVICTIPLSRLSVMDLSKCSIAGFNYPLWASIRELHYGEATKIALCFTQPWWQQFGIVGGQSKTDLSIRTTVYPSYPANSTTKSNVLIVSYCWSQDAARLGGLCRGDGTADPELIAIVLRDLSALHQVTVEMLQSVYTGKYHAWNWQQYPHTMGAYAQFAAGQFEDRMYPEVTKTQLNGRLFIAGEATSSCHAWVAGAFDSAWNAMYNYLTFHEPTRLAEFKEKWGDSEYWESDKQHVDHLKLGLYESWKKGQTAHK